MEWRDMVQRNADRVGKILLLGNENKRKIFFEQAIAENGIAYEFCDYKDLNTLCEREDLSSSILKIDPPLTDCVKIEEIARLTAEYRQQLEKLSGLAVKEYFNTPQSILTLLDKRKCKQTLMGHGLPVTKMYETKISDAEELLTFMAEERIPQLFIKPLTGSGAAGVTALRFSKARGRIVLYSCARLDRGVLVNTKRLQKIEDAKARELLDALLLSDCILEKWHAKSSYQGYRYDIRVVVQNGCVSYILPRLSKGPVTNLHLNNHAEYYENLGLAPELTGEIYAICKKAVGCFEGLTGAGIDVLIERGRPYIIEMNAQGDLIYQDIYNANRIYTDQVRIMRERLEEKGYE